MPVFPLYPKPITLAWTQTPVHPFDSEILHCVTHTGTHMDAPSHFLKGTDSIEDIGLDRCVAPGAVVDLRSVGAQGLIGRDSLRRGEEKRGRRLERGDAALLWTGWGKHWHSPDFLTDYPGLTEDGAQYLSDREVALVGIDTANVDHPEAEEFPAHKTLLCSGIPVVENLARLGSIRSSAFAFVALPLAIVGATGSPVRALAIVEG